MPITHSTKRNGKTEESEDNSTARFCRGFTKFLASHIGLCLMVVLYSMAGGFIFQYLEETNEKQRCIKKMEEYVNMANATRHELWEASVALVNQYRKDNEDSEREWEALFEVMKYLVKFRDDTLMLGYDGRDCHKMGEEGGPGYQWSFPGALLFSVTVITTVGNRLFSQ